MDPSIAGLMNAVEDGEASAADSLFSALYAKLHRLAKRKLARPGAAVNLSPNDLAPRTLSGYVRVARELRFPAELGSWDTQSA